jgi:transposase
MENTNEITDGITSGVEVRKQRGLEIAAIARIDKVDDLYIVPSQSRPTRYKVWMDPASPASTCTCPDNETRQCKCKHIYAVEYMLRREQSVTIEPNGTTTVTESVTVTKTRKTYPQNWPAYNDAQQNEKREFQSLLADLCRDLPTPPQTGRGQRRLPVSDAVFCAVFKIYSTMSARRFTSDLCDAQAKGYIDKVPHFNSVLNALENPDLYPILLNLIERSSLPLRSVEKDFAVDSTGFAFCRFVRWYDIKYNRFTAEQQWVKTHICTGVKTNVVTAVEIHGRDQNDSPILPALVDATAKNFTMAEVSADKGYSGCANHDAIAKIGAVPYIAFKGNTTGNVGGLFGKMWHFFQFNKEDFLNHYHKRSNVESTVMMVKSKFGDAVRSKTDVAARNEVLAKILCHNICCLISAIYELGIDPVFCTTKDSAAQREASK